MTKLGLSRILERQAKEPEPILEADVASKVGSTPAPEPVPKTPAEVFEQAQTAHQNVVSKLQDAKTKLAADERDLLGIEGTISRAVSLDARGGKTYGEEARVEDQKRLADLTQAVVGGKKTIETLEKTEAQTAETLAQVTVDFLLSEIRRHEQNGKALQERLFGLRDLGIALFAELKAEQAATGDLDKDYVRACQKACRLCEGRSLPNLLGTWEITADTLKGQR